MLRRILLIAVLLLLPCAAFAQFQPMVPPVGVGTPDTTLPPPANPVITDPATLTSTYENLVPAWLAAEKPYAYDLFFALAGLEVAVFGWNLWRSYGGDVREALLATTNKILIIGFFLDLLMNGNVWMADIIDMFVSVGKAASNMPTLGPSTIVLQGFQIFGNLLWQSVKVGTLVDIPTGLALILASFVICLSFLVIAFQFIITKIQTFLAIGMGFIFLGFGGSRWTTPYVERYFAYAVASGVKLMGLYILIGAGWSLSNQWITRASAAPLATASVATAWSIMCGSLLYAGICWMGSAQISSMLGGSPNLSHSDFVSFLGPMIQAVVTTGVVAASAVTGGAAGAAAGGAKAATTAATSAAAAAPAAGATPQTSPGGGGGKGGMLGQMAQIGASAINRAPHGGSHTPPPTFQGFHH